MFSTSTGLSANETVVAIDDIIEAVKQALAVRYGEWQKPFRMEITLKKGDFTAVNESIRDLAVEATSVCGEDDVALAVADHSRTGLIPHHEIRAAADYALAELKLKSGLTYAQREAVPEAFQGCLAEVPDDVLSMEV